LYLGNLWLSVLFIPHERNGIVFVASAYDFPPSSVLAASFCLMNLRVAFDTSGVGGILPNWSFFGCSMFNIWPLYSCRGCRPSQPALFFLWISITPLLFL